MGNRQALWRAGKSCRGMLFLGGVVWLGLALGLPWKSVEAHRASQDESEQKLLRRIDGLAESLTRMAPEKMYDAYQRIPLELRREVYVRLTPEAKAAIWRGHYRYCLDSLPLNPQQRECINKASEMTSPALYQPSADTGEFADTVEGYRPYFESGQFAFIFYGEEPLVGGQGRGVFSLRTDPRLQPRTTQNEPMRKLLDTIDGLAESLTRMAPEKMYDAYQRIPLELRREVYVRLTPEAKAAIWRGHYRYCLDSLPLNPQQRECINKASEMTSPALYQPSADTGEFADTVEGYRPYFESGQFAFIFYGEEPLVGGQGRGVFSLRTDPRLRWAAGCNCRTYVGRAGNYGGMSKCDTGPCSPYPSCGQGGTQVCDGLCGIN